MRLGSAQRTRWSSRPIPVAIPIAAACGWLAFASTGCGNDPHTVATATPLKTFAPLVQLHPRERWRPMGVDWFIARSSFWFAEEEECPDRKIAVGSTLKSQRNEVTDWIYPEGLGGYPGYWREGYDANCEPRNDARHYANEHTRPFAAKQRAHRLPLREGYYLDLADRARPGPAPRAGGKRASAVDAPVYGERRNAAVNGKPGLRLTYWMLYGMNEPLAGGRPIGRLSHEGDWERVDILIERDDDAYRPAILRIHHRSGHRDIPWDTLTTAASGDGEPSTHPVLSAARGSHDLRPRRRCGHCPQWRTWTELEDAPRQDWYGFGGAWGEVGPTDATTGPTGPHHKWRTADFPDAVKSD